MGRRGKASAAASSQAAAASSSAAKAASAAPAAASSSQPKKSSRKPSPDSSPPPSPKRGGKSIPLPTKRSGPAIVVALEPELDPDEEQILAEEGDEEKSNGGEGKSNGSNGGHAETSGPGWQWVTTKVRRDYSARFCMHARTPHRRPHSPSIGMLACLLTLVLSAG